VVSGCVVLCDLKHDNEQLYAISIVGLGSPWAAYYGSAQVGHLYFFGSALQTPQRTSDIVLFVGGDRDFNFGKRRRMCVVGIVVLGVSKMTSAITRDFCAPRRVPNRAKSRGELPLLITPPRFRPLAR